MVCQSRCHRRSALVPFATIDGLRPSYSQCKMWANKIEYRVLQIDMALQVRALLRMRQGLAHQAAIALARGQVVAFDIRGVDLLIAKNFGEDCSRTKDSAPPYFHHPSPFPPFVDLGIQQSRISHSLRGRVRSARPSFGQCR